MFDEFGSMLYVGKAKDLKKRVKAYTSYDRHPTRLRRMIRATTAMEFVITESETEALILEASLIKRLKPRYNILLRGDKSFPYILVRKDHPAAQVTKHRGARKIKGEYYGPFASAGAVNRTLDTLQRAFRLRNCTDSIYESRTRPCLQYQIKRCSAPCTGEISLPDYQNLIEDAEDFLTGKSDTLRQRLQSSMEAASRDMEFEKAAELRDRIRAMAQVSTKSGAANVNPRTFSNADVMGLYTAGGRTCVQVFFFRAGQNWGTNSYFPRHSSDDPTSQVLGAFIAQFYSNKPIPKQILLSHEVESHDLLVRALSERAAGKVEITVPQRGEKKKIVGQVVKNAEEALGRKLAETGAQEKLLKELQDLFGMEDMPQRVEVYDNSHIQGTNAVGVMIVAGSEGFMKNQYRKFNIRGDDLTPGDDFGMMKEVLNRRFKRLIKEDPDRTGGLWPDLLLIDGGAGQVSAVEQIMQEHGVQDIPMVGVAKGVDRDAGKEEFHRTGKRPFALRHNDPVLYFVQRLRDEAHRFAIGTHRAKRSKAIGATPRDEVPGVGAARKRALLAHFGSAKAVARANLADLKAAEGVSDALANTIYDFFHERG